LTLLGTIVNAVLSALLLAIFVRSIITWFPISPNHPFRAMLDQITEPILLPIRRLLPRTGSLDLSPMVAILLILLIQTVLNSL